MQIKDRYKKFNAHRTKSAEDKEITVNAKESRSDKRIFIG
jgi:hypothetical protein